MRHFLIFAAIIIMMSLESCHYKYCATYQSQYRKSVREVALKGKKKTYSQGYSIYKRGLAR